jgi:hypothetical protein
MRRIIYGATAICLLLLLVACDGLQNSSARSFPMSGVNLSDLQPDEIIENIVRITKASSDDIIVPDTNNFTI